MFFETAQDLAMNDRYFIAISYGAFWLILGWGTYVFVVVRRKFRAKHRDDR